MISFSPQARVRFYGDRTTPPRRFSRKLLIDGPMIDRHDARSI